MIDRNEKAAEKLYDYTKFHLGLYTAVAAAIVAAAKFSQSALCDWMFLTVMALLAIAGACGGVISANYLEWLNADPNESRSQPNDRNDGYLEKKIGPWGQKWFSCRCFARIEHAAFWLSIATAIVHFARR